jgi:K+-sensing histidine kinase KdpD
LTTFYFGWIFGLLASILATFSGFYFFIAPYDSFAMPSVSDCYVIAVNICTMMACVFAIEFLQRSSYASTVLLKASKNNYRLFIRSENQLLNLRRDIAEHEKLIHAITSTEESPLLWANPYEVICYFEKSNQLIPVELIIQAEGKFLNLFSTIQQPIVLNHINTCLSENAVVEFSFVWATKIENKHDLIGRMTPIIIDRKKSIVFSIVKN